MIRTNLISKDRAIREIKAGVNKYRQGYFVTIDSIHQDYRYGNRLIDDETIIDFGEDLMEAAHGLNKYCYGRNHKNSECKFNVYGAMEIGKDTSRLHAHILMLFDKPSERSSEDFTNRLITKIAPKLSFAEGVNGIKIEPLDLQKAEGFPDYALKSYNWMFDKYGVSSLVLL